ncbi:MAG: hypothetical protein KDD44_14515, partial [Bdellovibrionales bacterium]|nr:hypothetical protein [Bdellovibrionales bacterium]
LIIERKSKMFLHSSSQTSTQLLMLVLYCCTLAACNGGGGNDSSDVLFSGTVGTEPAATRSFRVLPDMTVCGLGACDTTDANGVWSFTIPSSAYSGGQAEFTITGAAFENSIVVADLLPSSHHIVLDFTAQNDGSVALAALNQDGTPTTVPTPGDSADDDTDLSGLSPSDRACKIIEQSNIVITDAVDVFQADNNPANCPNGITNVIAVGNPGAFPFLYQISVDHPDIIVQPNDGALDPDQLEQHDALYFCTQAQSFEATITVDITFFDVPGADPITAQEAVDLCGANRASVGNLSDSRILTVTVN